ncbi:nucleotidyltransferase domain-containing protein [Polaromonas glacialis]|uniref:nucleotidyltransferase domain-containing protein n=1 Tax=Polaromonas glacialis TaxID=866564 RepID=UPI00055E6EBE|nr:nucleotidyltransferase domain-containing protein [Polaromonas glacialis]
MALDSLSAQSGLSPATLEKIITVLARCPALEKAVLYGSRAKGNHRPGSDIDLSLFGDTLSHAHLGQIESQLDDLMLPYSFDISLFSQIDNPDLTEHIQRVGLVFYEKSSLAENLGKTQKQASV